MTYRRHPLFVTKVCSRRMVTIPDVATRCSRGASRLHLRETFASVAVAPPQPRLWLLDGCRIRSRQPRRVPDFGDARADGTCGCVFSRIALLASNAPPRSADGMHRDVLPAGSTSAVRPPTSPAGTPPDGPANGGVCVGAGGTPAAGRPSTSRRAIRSALRYARASSQPPCGDPERHAHETFCLPFDVSIGRSRGPRPFHLPRPYPRWRPLRQLCPIFRCCRVDGEAQRTGASSDVARGAPPSTSWHCRTHPPCWRDADDGEAPRPLVKVRSRSPAPRRSRALDGLEHAGTADLSAGCSGRNR